MFSHAHANGAPISVPARAKATRPANCKTLGGVRVIAATAINAEVPISTETPCRSIDTKGA